ncbi:MAG: homoserine kinase, partial [Chloroflexi bacterium]|nr:homoserine kinase [Chloroflexota bacterium]
MSASSVAVEVPATSANLGSGFDSLGVALDWALRLRFTLHDDPQPVPTDPIALMAGRAALTLYNMAAIAPPAGLEVTVEPDGPPVGRGLGLSAAARVAGVIAANALTSSDFDPEKLLPLAVQLERHADNAVPAMFGGLQVVVEHDLDGVLHLGL